MRNKIKISRPSLGLFPIFLLVLSGIGVSILIAVIALFVVHRKKIKTIAKELWRAFISYEINERAWWVKFIKNAKIPGLKDAVKPGLHVFKRIAWFGFVTVCFGFGVYWIIHLSRQIVQKPVTLVHSEVKVSATLVPFPEAVANQIGNFQIHKSNEIRALARKAFRLGSVVDSAGLAWNDDETATLLVVANHLCNAKLDDGKWQDEGNTTISQVLLETITTEKIYEPQTKGGVELNVTKIVTFLNSARGRCRDMMKACSWGGKRIPCTDAFVEVQTDIGAGCSFNKIPYSALRSDQTWQSKLTDEVACSKDIETWKTRFNIDKDLLSPTKRDSGCINSAKGYQKTIPLTQPAPGKQFGLSYVAQFDEDNATCLQAEKGLGHFLEINSVMDDSNMLRNGIMLPHNHVIHITLEAVIITSEEEIRWFQPIHRKCIFTDEAKDMLQHYHMYTEENCLKECASEAIKEKCECGLIPQPNAPGTRLCTTQVDLECAKGVQHSTIPCPKCLPGCTELKYRISELSMVPYNSETAPDIVKQNVEPGKTSVNVHISFKLGHFIIQRRTITYDWAELFGLIGGVLGLTNGFSFIDGGRLFDASYQFVLDQGKGVFQYLVGLSTAFFGCLWLRKKCIKNDGVSEFQIQNDEPDNDMIVANILGNNIHQVTDLIQNEGPLNSDFQELIITTPELQHVHSTPSQNSNHQGASILESIRQFFGCNCENEIEQDEEAPKTMPIEELDTISESRDSQTPHVSVTADEENIVAVESVAEGTELPSGSVTSEGDPVVRRRGLLKTIRNLVRRPTPEIRDSATSPKNNIQEAMQTPARSVNSTGRRERRRSLLNLILHGRSEARRSSVDGVMEIQVSPISTSGLITRPCSAGLRRMSSRVVPASESHSAPGRSGRETPAIFLAVPSGMDGPTRSNLSWEYLGVI